MKTIYLLFIIIIPLQVNAQNFDRALFYLNMNECINCQMFLKNYVLAIQNSKEKILYVDSSTEYFIEDYLLSKGIDPREFDRIEFSDLSERLGLFDSFIVIHDGVNIDTLYVKEPLMSEYRQDGSLENGTMDTDCSKFSNRLKIFAVADGFIVWDNVFREARKLKSTAGDDWICQKIVFDREFKILIQKRLMSSDSSLLFTLTNELELLLSQLDMNDIELLSVGLGLRDSAECYLLKVPYVFREKQDTVVSSINVIYIDDNHVYRCGTEELDDLEVDYNYDIGFYTLTDTVLLPIVDEQSYSISIAKMPLNAVGVFDLLEVEEIMALPEKYRKNGVHISLIDGHVVVGNTAYIYDLSKGLLINLSSLGKFKTVEYLGISHPKSGGTLTYLIGDKALYRLKTNLYGATVELNEVFEIDEFQEYWIGENTICGLDFYPTFVSKCKAIY